MAMTPAAEAGTAAEGTGRVTAIDQDAGTITIQHGPIAAVDWPAMTMPFQASEELRRAVQVGDEVSFSFRGTGGGGELTAISKR